MTAGDIRCRRHQLGLGQGPARVASTRQLNGQSNSIRGRHRLSGQVHDSLPVVGRFTVFLFPHERVGTITVQSKADLAGSHIIWLDLEMRLNPIQSRISLSDGVVESS